MNTYADGVPCRIALGRRDHIAGLVKGIEGMREGGKRELTVSPHLAYGAKGAGKVPPNAVLRFEVELLEVLDPGTATSHLYPPGKQLVIFRPGEAARNLPQIQFGVWDDGRTGGSISHPVPGGTWRHARPKTFEFPVSTSEARQLIESALSLPKEFPKDVLEHDDLWADASEKANSITRNRRTNELCVTITVYERGQSLCYYALPETSPALLKSLFYSVLMAKLKAQLQPA
ncbi:MAG: FKBP-type peptidylprolyl isomerase [Limisphaerales bacterium]|nr:MAG: FKBP-type peptidylprolyl isomerase [Limisphaerales bacterium]KAG0508571.1 MAG: FKBP-type peptidylprolyl isomerase [Limisphaerales bacterium]TXT50117.1 MAG: FKBP-type peptidylprolyl isomerase [Limisphaerales bacterium]